MDVQKEQALRLALAQKLGSQQGLHTRCNIKCSQWSSAASEAPEQIASRAAPSSWLGNKLEHTIAMIQRIMLCMAYTSSC
jgi:hypothetical protein